MSGLVSNVKADLRRRIRGSLRAMSREDHAAGSALVCQRLLGQSEWKSAKAVLCFVPMADEPDIRPVIEAALAAGKQVALPRFSAESSLYLPCLIYGWPGDLEPGRFGILEPGVHCPAFDVKQLDLALVPGIGFTPGGGRLGRGKGYYDRLLAGYSGFKCGVAFDCQLTDEFPLEPHDVRLNCILTPTRWHSAGNQPRS